MYFYALLLIPTHKKFHLELATSFPSTPPKLPEGVRNKLEKMLLKFSYSVAFCIVSEAFSRHLYTRQHFVIWSVPTGHFSTLGKQETIKIKRKLKMKFFWSIQCVRIHLINSGVQQATSQPEFAIGIYFKAQVNASASTLKLLHVTWLWRWASWTLSPLFWSVVYLWLEKLTASKFFSL